MHVITRNSAELRFDNVERESRKNLARKEKFGDSILSMVFQKFFFQKLLLTIGFILYAACIYKFP